MKKDYLLFILALLPIVAYAESVEIDGIYYNIVKKAKTAEVLKTPFYDNWSSYSGDIVIPPTVTYEGVECCVTSIASRTFYKCSGLTSVTIPNSITSIGENAFYLCSSLTSVHITDLEAWCKISFDSNPLGAAQHLYLNGVEIKDLVIPHSVTSIGSAFSGCSGLTSVTIHKDMTSIDSHAFSGCSGLESIKVENGNTVYDSRNDCNAIIRTNDDKLILGCKNTIIPFGVTRIGENAFYECNGLTSITIPSSVTNIEEWAFSGCSGLTSLTIPHNVISIGSYAFSRCSGLTTATIPNSVNSIGSSAFYECSSLTTVIIPNSVKTIGDWAFSHNKSLSTIIIGNGIETLFYGVFAYCEALTDVYCYVTNVPDSYGATFDNSFIEYATLHVPVGSVDAYNKSEPWSNFKRVVAVGEDEVSESPKCATPTISLVDGEIQFNCETEGTEFFSEVTVSDAKAYNGNKISAPKKFKVTVYATKSGFENSEKVTKDFDFSNDTAKSGDVNGDGDVNVADHVKLTEIIMNKTDDVK